VHAAVPVVALDLWLARSTPWALTAGSALACVGLVVRGLAAGQLRKHETLVTSGLYAATRNPLYLGSAVMAAGFALAVDSVAGALILFGYFAAFYPATIRWEERRLEARYGSEFTGYSGRVPRLCPRWPVRSPWSGFSWRWYWRNGEFAAAVGLVAGVAALAVKMVLHRPAVG
jgi:protein-S-isoprenylcysteine O-methyltransferase Ste14